MTKKLKLTEQLELIKSKDVERFRAYVSECAIPFSKKALEALFKEGNDELIEIFITTSFDAQYLDEFAKYDVWFARFAPKHVVADGLRMQFFGDEAKKEILKRDKKVFITFMDVIGNVLTKDELAFLMEQGEDMNLNYYFLAYEEISRESIVHIMSTLPKYGDKYLQMLWFSSSGDDFLRDYRADCPPEALPLLDAFMKKVDKFTEDSMNAEAEAAAELRDEE